MQLTVYCWVCKLASVADQGGDEMKFAKYTKANWNTLQLMHVSREICSWLLHYCCLRVTPRGNAGQYILLVSSQRYNKQILSSGFQIRARLWKTVGSFLCQEE